MAGQDFNKNRDPLSVHREAVAASLSGAFANRRETLAVAAPPPERVLGRIRAPCAACGGCETAQSLLSSPTTSSPRVWTNHARTPTRSAKSTKA